MAPGAERAALDTRPPQELTDEMNYWLDDTPYKHAWRTCYQQSGQNFPCPCCCHCRDECHHPDNATWPLL